MHSPSDRDRSGEASETRLRGSTEGKSPGPKGIAMTSWSIGEQSSPKPLNPFGSATIHRPISEAIAQAEATELYLQAQAEREMPL